MYLRVWDLAETIGLQISYPKVILFDEKVTFVDKKVTLWGQKVTFVDQKVTCVCQQVTFFGQTCWLSKNDLCSTRDLATVVEREKCCREPVSTMKLTIWKPKLWPKANWNSYSGSQHELRTLHPLCIKTRIWVFPQWSKHCPSSTTTYRRSLPPKI